MEFQGKKVVITGAAGVFGAWIAEAFAREGALLCLADMRADAAQAVLDRCKAAKGSFAQQVELTDEVSILALVAAVKRNWDAPDIVINNAGVYPSGLLLEIPTAEWDRIIDINLRAPYIVTRELARLMIANKVKGGSVVNISSGAARKMRNGHAPYSLSKTALNRLSMGFALELAEHGIRVNVVEPGFAPGSAVSKLTEDHVRKTSAKIPLGRSSGPNDAPQAVLYLCSEKAGFITGSVLSVDGGNSIGTFEPGPLKA